jgi:UDP-N-acetyl-D-galactosamine dehydrogenase
MAHGALKKGDIVVYESTGYPGAVEEDCVPILERASGLEAGSDFDVGIRPSASIPVTGRGSSSM